MKVCQRVGSRVDHLVALMDDPMVAWMVDSRVEKWVESKESLLVVNLVEN